MVCWRWGKWANRHPGHYKALKKFNIPDSVSTDTNEVFRNQQIKRSIPAEYFLAIDLFRQPIQYSFLRINVLVIIETGIVQCLHHRRYGWMMMSILMDKNCLKISTYTVKQSLSAKTWQTSVQEKFMKEVFYFTFDF